MENNVINTGTITMALRGRDLFRRMGYSAYIGRQSGPTALGCGYIIKTSCPLPEAYAILKQNEIKYIIPSGGERV